MTRRLPSPARYRLTVGLIGAALVLGGFAAFSARAYISEQVAAYRAALDARYSPARVVVATASLPAGTTLESNRVAVREVPREFLHRDAIAPEEWAALDTRITRHQITAGAPILRSQLTGPGGERFADLIDQGKRAMTFPVDQVSSISGMLAPGDRIDIAMALRREGQPLVVPLMKNTEVVATGEYTDVETLERRRFATVTIMATPGEASRILYAQEVGSLRVVLRATGDLSDQWPERMTLARLLGEPEPSRPRERSQRTIDVIVGGR